MGKKKKQRKKITKWVEAEGGIEFDDLVYAGVGVLAKAARKGKKKAFKKAKERGEEVASLEIEALDQLLGLDEQEPVVSYSHNGGGWYDIDIDGFVVDRVQGEREAATRAGELLEAYAAHESDERDFERTGIYEVGGGWYEVFAVGVPLGRLQGKEEADARFEEISSLNSTS